MIIAKQKKEENIAEYILYMWQVEDMIRANHLDIESIQKNIIDQYPQSEEVKTQIREWYENLVEMMHLEHKEESGHLQININQVDDLNDLHLELMQNPKEIQYNALFFKTMPFLVEFRAKLHAGEEMNDVHLALHALYAVLLLRLQRKEVTEQTMVAVQHISQLIAVLAQKYQKWLKEEPED